MENIDNKFEEDWKKAFDSAEEEPSPMLWQNIENKLAQNDIIVYKKKFYYTQAAAAVLLLLILPLFAYFVYHFENDSIAVHATKESNKIDVVASNQKNEKGGINSEKNGPNISNENNTSNSENLKSIKSPNGVREMQVSKAENEADTSLEPTDLKDFEGRSTDFKKEDINKNNGLRNNQKNEVAHLGSVEFPEKSTENIGASRSLTNQKNTSGSQPLATQRAFESDANSSKIKSKNKNSLALEQQKKTNNETLHSAAFNNEKQREGSLEIAGVGNREKLDSNDSKDGEKNLAKDLNSAEIKSFADSGLRKKGKSRANKSVAGTSNNSKGIESGKSTSDNLLINDIDLLDDQKNDFTKNYVTTLDPISPKGAQQREVRLKKMYLYFWQNESLYAVNEIKKENKLKGKRWSANADFTPSYTHQNFSSNSTPSTPSSTLASSGSFFADASRTTQQQSAKELEMLSKPQFSYSSGINGAYRVTEKLSVEVGLKYTYSQAKIYTNNYVEDLHSSSQYPAFNLILKESTNDQVILYKGGPETSTSNPGTIYGYNSTKTASNNLSSPTSIDGYKNVSIFTQYVGVPLTVNYKLLDKKIDISIGGGVSTDFFIQYGSKKEDGLEAEKISGSDNSIFRPFAFSFLLTPEFAYSISDRSSFYLRPVYKGALQSFTDDKELSNKPNSTGVGFGIRYNFK
jgi:hypothetical protein